MFFCEKHTMNDIRSRDDVKILVDGFYTKVLADELLAPVFSHINLPDHLPTMYDFWSSLLFGDKTYTGNPLQKHLSLPLQPAHFTRWLHLFTETVNENFSGDKAVEIQDRARSIAGVFQHKMGLIP